MLAVCGRVLSKVHKCTEQNNKKGGVKMLKANKLKSKIIERETTIEQLSSKMAIDRATFYRKLKKNSFYVHEVETIAKELRLSNKEINDIFFG
jgi:transcriptional regulator of acetoin/glycerol metabolism